MADNHYGWFERLSLGIYDLTPEGKKALLSYADDIASISDRGEPLHGQSRANSIGKA